MTTADLIKEIESARRVARDLADVSEADMREAAKVAEKIDRELLDSEEKFREAIKTLRRAGLLK
jgi:hypothetical protein